MKRKYLVAVFLLLGIGVLTTMAISYTEVNLDESWGAMYTVNYVDAELSLDDPETTINNHTSVTVEMSASHSPTNVKSQILVEAQDINTDAIVVDGDGATVKVIFEDTVGGTAQKKVKSVGAGSPFRETLAMDTEQPVDKVTIIWLKQTAFTNTYQYGSFTVTDLE